MDFHIAAWTIQLDHKVPFKTWSVCYGAYITFFWSLHRIFIGVVLFELTDNHFVLIEESGCLLPSLPSDAVFDRTSGIGFICDLNDNIVAPWPSTSYALQSSCNRSMSKLDIYSLFFFLLYFLWLMHLYLECVALQLQNFHPFLQQHLLKMVSKHYHPLRRIFSGVFRAVLHMKYTFGCYNKHLQNYGFEKIMLINIRSEEQHKKVPKKMQINCVPINMLLHW